MKVSSTCFKLSLLKRARYLSCKMARVEISDVNKTLQLKQPAMIPSSLLFRAYKRLNYKYANRLKRTGKLLTAQMLPGLYLCVSTKLQLDLNGIDRKV